MYGNVGKTASISVLAALGSWALGIQAVAQPTPPLAADAPAAALEAAGATVEDVRDCLRRSVLEHGRMRELEVSVEGAAGASPPARMALYWRVTAKDDRLTLHTVEASSFAPVAYLLITNDRGQQLLAYDGASQRIETLDEAAEIPGTQLGLVELRQAQGLLPPGQTERLADQAIDGQSVYVLDTRSPEQNLGYRRVKSYVHQDSCTLIQAEYFDEDDRIEKVLRGDLRKLVPLGFHGVLLAYDVRRPGGAAATRVTMGVAAEPKTLPDGLFSPQGFFRGSTNR